jgi:hypothetical protein
MSCFQLSVGVVVHAGDIDGYGSVALGIVVDWKVDIRALACAVFLVDVFGAPIIVARRLGGDAVVFAVGHGDLIISRSKNELSHTDKHEQQNQKSSTAA